ncbi:hypothetical protein CBR_g28568 [Chara braunii]|uniref:Cleavage/polyadenylation specificity factor A subunit C-terminal domain-containing protein n=1 Tax=Chara braunii TaxID=69332 RepID=A0A388JWI8_CHABU|nr:hypothetical protein CBR_g28568 [Chara braunii]|eukprot:GBG62092.1 hypothetical protein CBR_g28568 [Chara braunii]
MSYTAFKTVHWPTGVECCAAVYLTHCSGDTDSETGGWVGSTAGPEFGWYTATTPGPQRTSFWNRVNGKGSSQEASDVKEAVGWVLPNLVVTKGNVLEVYIIRADAEETPDENTAALTARESGASALGGRRKAGAAFGATGVWLESACSYHLHGNVESLAVLTHRRDEGRRRRDALLLAFREAKVSVLDFDDATHSLRTSSLHYYEGPEWVHLKGGREVFARGPILRADPQGRCAAMVVYGAQMIVFKASQALFGLEEEEERSAASRGRKCTAAIELSYVVNLREVNIKSVRDFVFLHGYIEPTLLLLHEEEPTWAGRASTKRFTCSVAALSINTTLRQHPIIYSAKSLPYDACTVLAVPAPIGGVVVLAANSLHYHSQSSACVLALNDLAAFPEGTPPPPRSTLNVELDAAQATWIANNTALISTKTGDLLLLSMVYDGRGVQALELSKSKGSVLCSCICTLGDEFFFLGSRLADSLLVQYTANQGGEEGSGTVEELSSAATAAPGTPERSPSEQDDASEDGEGLGDGKSRAKRMRRSLTDLSIDSCATAEELSVYRTSPGVFDSLQRKTFTYEVCDSLLNIGPLRDFAYGRRPNFDPKAAGLAKQSNFQLLACSGHGKNGALSVLQSSLRPDLITEVELPGCQGIWTVYHRVGEEEEEERKEEDLDAAPREAGLAATLGWDDVDSEFHAYLVLSMESRTMVLETGEFLNEVTETVEYYTAGPTIAVGNLFDRRRVVQVYARGVRLLDGATKSEELVFGESSNADPVDEDTVPEVADSGKEGGEGASGGEGQEGRQVKEEREEAKGEEEGEGRVVSGAGEGEGSDSKLGVPGDGCSKADEILVTSACVSDPFVLLTMTDGSLRLVVGNPITVTLELIAPSLVGDTSDLVTACSLYRDRHPHAWLVDHLADKETQQTLGSDQSKSKGEGCQPRAESCVYCVACRRSGRLELYSLPAFACVFSVEGFHLGKSVLINRGGQTDGEGMGKRPLTKIIEEGEGETETAMDEEEPATEETNEATTNPESAEKMEVDGVPDGETETADACEKKGDDDAKVKEEIGEGERRPMVRRRGRRIVDASQEIGEIFVREICMERFGDRFGRPFLLAIRSDGVMLCYRGFRYYDGRRESSAELNCSAQDSERCGQKEKAAANGANEALQHAVKTEGESGGAEEGRAAAAADKTADARSTLDHLRFERRPINWVPCEGDVQEPGKGCKMICFRNVGGHRGVFITGVRPVWLISLRERFRPHPQLCDQGITAFTPLHNVNCDRGFIYLSSEGVLKICQLPTYLSYDSDWPVQKVPLRVTPHHIAYHPDANVYALVTSSPVKRTLLQAMIPSAEGLSGRANAADASGGGGAAATAGGNEDEEPMVDVEEFEIRVVNPGGNWETKESTTFHLMENVLTARIVNMKNSKTSQLQTLLAVGTAFVHGEDVAAKGRILLFHITDPGEDASGSWIQEVFSKELKGAISAVAAVQGRLLIAVGPKIILHTWDGSDLSWAAFFDAPLYIVSLNTVKNFVLVGDVHKSIFFLSWKEEENQLKLLARDFESLDVYATEFLIDGGILSLLVTDSDKNLQVFSFSPKRVESWKGQKLLPRAEFHIGAHVAKFLRLPMLPIASAPRTNRAAVLFGTLDGGLDLIAPVDELTFRRLQTLQGWLVGAVAHTAGLNPVSFRRFKSPGKAHFPGPQNIIDCNLIAHYAMMELGEQVEIARQCGTTRTQIFANLCDLAVSTSFF